MGHEGCGIVEEIGPGVTTVKVGDKVVMHWRKGDGIESNFPSYIYNDKKMSSGKVTTISEYSVVSENRLTTVPDDTPEELCALLGCAMTTAIGTITNEAQVKFGESVLVVGCGGLGLHLIEAAKLSNAYPIIGIDITDEKEELSKETWKEPQGRQSPKTDSDFTEVDLFLDSKTPKPLVLNYGIN